VLTLPSVARTPTAPTALAGPRIEPDVSGAQCGVPQARGVGLEEDWLDAAARDCEQ
jgi:hypothetical protein